MLRDLITLSFKCLENIPEVVCKEKHSQINYYEVVKQKREAIYLADKQ